MADTHPGSPASEAIAPRLREPALVVRCMRAVLWTGVVFNLLVALMLVFPATLGGFAALPPVGSDFYRWMLVYFVCCSARRTRGWRCSR